MQPEGLSENFAYMYVWFVLAQEVFRVK